MVAGSSAAPGRIRASAPLCVPCATGTTAIHPRATATTAVGTRSGVLPTKTLAASRRSTGRRGRTLKCCPTSKQSSNTISSHAASGAYRTSHHHQTQAASNAHATVIRTLAHEINAGTQLTTKYPRVSPLSRAVGSRIAALTASSPILTVSTALASIYLPRHHHRRRQTLVALRRRCHCLRCHRARHPRRCHPCPTICSRTHLRPSRGGCILRRLQTVGSINGI